MRQGQLAGHIAAAPQQDEQQRQAEGGLADADTLYAVYLPGRTPRHPAPKVRALIDFLLEKLGDVPPWDREESP
ncbi:MAG: hypothetical protein ACK44A_14245 [Roseateles sp.]